MFKTRTLLATAITLAMIFSPSISPAAWADGTEKTTTGSPKTDGGTTAPADNGSKESRSPSAVESELSQLKEELSTQRAILDAQQARIAELEAQLHGSTAKPVIPVPGATADSGPISRASEPAGVAAQPIPAQPIPAQSGGSAENQKKSPLSFKLGPAEFTPGAWVDLTGIFRSTDIGSGTGTTFGSIPYNNTTPQADLSEFRFTAQTSRLWMRVDIPAGESTHVTGYVESDFNGFQPPNAYISTNSNTFRLRLAWADIHHGKWEFLGGQSWSLLTPNRFGLSPLPQDIFTSYRLDTSYLAGLTFLRQAGVRAVYHATDWWTLGASLENPQQFAPSSVVFPGASGYFASQFDNGSGATNAGSATTNTAIPNLVPDLLVKTAFDWKPRGRAFHVEAAGLIRTFKDYNNLVTPNATDRATGGSGAVNADLELFKNFRLIANTFYGEGGGRYIGGLGPDLVVKPNGTISPVHSGSGVGGFEWQVTQRFLVESYYSGAYFARDFGLLASTATPAPKCDGVSGFTCVGFGFPGSANMIGRFRKARSDSRKRCGRVRNTGSCSSSRRLRTLSGVRGRWHPGVRKTPTRSWSISISGTFSRRVRIQADGCIARGAACRLAKHERDPMPATACGSRARTFRAWIPWIRPVNAFSISLGWSRRFLRGQPAHSCHQSCEPWPVFLTHCCELHSQTAARFHISDRGVGTYLPFLHEEVEIDDSSHGFERGGLEEQTTHAHILHGRNVSPPVAVPVDPYVLRGLHAGKEPSRWQRSHLPRICHTPPSLSFWLGPSGAAGAGC
jgi:hypothetical protein